MMRMLNVFISKEGVKLLTLSLSFLTLLMLCMLMLVSLAPKAEAMSRIKDIVEVEGIRDNLLIGYGLVVGLNGTGDSLSSSVFTERSLGSFLERLGISTNDVELDVDNVAAVTVTAVYPPFARNGSRIDIRVSALGDADSLRGGTLLATPLMGADGNVYAVAQGVVSIEGFEASGETASIIKGVPTNGYISNGAIVEREIEFTLNDLTQLNLALRNPDVATAMRISAAINDHMGGNLAQALDPGTVKVTVPESFTGNVTGLLANIEQLKVKPDQAAKIIIEESSGTIVMNENVKIDTVAIAQGNLTIRVNELLSVSQPGAFAPDSAETAVTPQTQINVSEEGRQMTVLPEAATVRDLVNGLNALGVSPRDLITILQTIKYAGALQADIEIR